VGLYDARLAPTRRHVVEAETGKWRWRCVPAPRAGLAAIDAILGRGELVDYHLAHSVGPPVDGPGTTGSTARRSYTKASGNLRARHERRPRAGSGELEKKKKSAACRKCRSGIDKGKDEAFRLGRADCS